MAHRPRSAARGRRIREKLKWLNHKLVAMAGPGAEESTVSAARRKLRRYRRQGVLATEVKLVNSLEGASTDDRSGGEGQATRTG